jgi:cytochrome c-type biogenesis protein
VPPYLAYMGGVSVSDMSEDRAARRRVFMTSVFCVLGLSTVFVILGFSFSFAGRTFAQYQDWFVTIAGAVVMIFGLHFLGVFRIGFLDREARFEGKDQGGSAFGA